MKMCVCVKFIRAYTSFTKDIKGAKKSRPVPATNYCFGKKLLSREFSRIKIRKKIKKINIKT